jgi:hypothetical protein
MKTSAVYSRKILNVPQTAEMLVTTEPAVRLLVFRRKIPHFKVNGRVLFDEADILRWLDSQRRVSVDDSCEAV